MRRYLIFFLYFLILPSCAELEDIVCAQHVIPIPTDDLKCDAPTAFNVHITGTVKVTELLTGNYEYFDSQGVTLKAERPFGGYGAIKTLATKSLSQVLRNRSTL